MRNAVLYARVACEEQVRNSSLASQVNMLRGYAASNAFHIVKEFKFSSAEEPGRKHFNAMLDYLRQHRDVRVLIVEKMDRLCRNLPDYVLVESVVEELGLEVHLVKEGQVLRRDSKSQDKLVQGIFTVMARNYILNLQEEILKGQIVKAEKGQYPGRAPFGYAHDRVTRTIVAHPTRARVVTLIFELYSSGRYSVDTLRKETIKQTGEKISKSNLSRMLKFRFYLGLFTWRGREHQGIHPRLVDSGTFERVQGIVSGRSKAKPHKHVFPFSGLLKCAKDDCAITAERHKEKYVYYRCSFGRGKHKFPYMPEQKVADMMGTLLKKIEIPAQVAQAIADSTRRDRAGEVAKRRREISNLNQRISMLHTRMRKAYTDKLDGVVDEAFWRMNNDDWSAEQRQLQCLSTQRIVELAKHAHSIYATGNYAERVQLLKMALFNCTTDGIDIYPTYRQPFNLIFAASRDQ